LKIIIHECEYYNALENKVHYSTKTFAKFPTKIANLEALWILKYIFSRVGRCYDVGFQNKEKWYWNSFVKPSNTQFMTCLNLLEKCHTSKYPQIENVGIHNG